MKKAVQLKVTLWIEGEDEPRHDFAASSIAAVRSLLSQQSVGTPPVKIKVKKIEEDHFLEDDEDDGDDDAADTDERLKVE